MAGQRKASRHPHPTAAGIISAQPEAKRVEKLIL
jgi:hypothetical protein